MGFVKFTATGARIGDSLISIWSRGQIGFSQGAMIEFGIAKYQYVVLYFDSDTNRIGFQLENDQNADGAIKLIFRKNSGASFSAVPFLRLNNINYKETRKYTLQKDEESGFLVVDLNKPRE